MIKRKLKSAVPKSAAVKAEPVKAQPIQAETAKPEPVKTQGVKATAPQGSRVSLEIVKPGAKTVCVAGSFNEWKPERTPLAPVGNGLWSGNLTVKAGRYEYLFVVDGQWLPDPNAKESVQNPFGGRNSLLVVSE